MFILGITFAAQCQHKKNIEGGSGYVTLTFIEKTNDGFKIYVNNYSSECTHVVVVYQNELVAGIQVGAWCARPMWVGNSNDYPNKIFDNVKIYTAKNQVLSKNDCRCTQNDKKLK